MSEETNEFDVSRGFIWSFDSFLSFHLQRDEKVLVNYHWIPISRLHTNVSVKKNIHTNVQICNLIIRTHEKVNKLLSIKKRTQPPFFKSSELTTQQRNQFDRRDQYTLSYFNSLTHFCLSLC